MKRIAIAVVVVGVAALGLFSARRFVGFANGGGKPEADVQLTVQGGVCGARAPVEDLGGGWKYKIKWNVKNVDCDIPQYVAFLEYRERIGSGFGPPENGIVDPDPAYSKRLARGDSDTVNGKIDKLHFSWTNSDKKYKYKICVGPNPNPSTNCLDPDVDVWPF